MIRWLLTLLPISAFAGPLDHIETAINAGYPEHVMTERAAKAWNKIYDPNGGIIEFLNAYRNGDYALMRTYWVSPNPPYTQSAWMLLKMEGDKADGFIWTARAPPRTWRPDATAGQAADVATTTAGLAMGFVEANPIVAAAKIPMFAVKIGGTWAAQEYGDPFLCNDAAAVLGKGGWAFSAVNGGVIGSTLGPVGTVLGAGTMAIGGYFVEKLNNPFWRCVPGELR